MEEKKETEKKEGWLNYLALATVIVALGATLSTLRVGSFSNRSILRQTQASDQWAYYQAKSIKGYLYDILKEKLELELRWATRAQSILLRIMGKKFNRDKR
jgi:hypothetical protein